MPTSGLGTLSFTRPLERFVRWRTLGWPTIYDGERSLKRGEDAPLLHKVVRHGRVVPLLKVSRSKVLRMRHVLDNQRLLSFAPPYFEREPAQVLKLDAFGGTDTLLVQPRVGNRACGRIVWH
jgi:hypothetical protein